MKNQEYVVQVIDHNNRQVIFTSKKFSSHREAQAYTFEIAKSYCYGKNLMKVQTTGAGKFNTGHLDYIIKKSN